MIQAVAKEEERLPIRSLIPARIDRLPWSRFHTMVVMALGVAWILDGLEITIASVVEGALTNKDTLNLSVAASGATASIYLAGEVVGALAFGRLSDKLGRKNLFMLTIGVYLIGGGLTAATLGYFGVWSGLGNLSILDSLYLRDGHWRRVCGY